jgi:hypothetical protein
MKEAATIIIRGENSSDNALMIVRYDEFRVALCLSLESNGDLEVVMKKIDVETLIQALRIAVSDTK